MNNLPDKLRSRKGTKHQITVLRRLHAHCLAQPTIEGRKLSNHFQMASTAAETRDFIPAYQIKI